MLKGAITAVVTPFTEKGSIDEVSLRNLVEFQIKNNIDGKIKSDKKSGCKKSIIWVYRVF